MSTITVPVSTLKCVCKLRWARKRDEDQMVIRNVDAMKCLFRSVIATSYDAEQAAETLARKKLDDELREYTAGFQNAVTNTAGFDMSDLGEPL